MSEEKRGNQEVVILPHSDASAKLANADELWNETPKIGVEALIATIDDSNMLIHALRKSAADTALKIHAKYNGIE